MGFRQSMGNTRQIGVNVLWMILKEDLMKNNQLELTLDRSLEVISRNIARAQPRSPGQEET